MVCLQEKVVASWGARIRHPHCYLRPLFTRRRVMESAPIHVDEDAAEYDAMVMRHAWLLNRPFVDMLGKLGLERGRVLDVGTGPGWIPIELALRNPGWEIWAVDASPDMLDRARQHAEDAGVSDRVCFVSGGATQLPFDDGHFDLTISHFMMHHIEHPIDFLDEMARVTRGGGRIVIKDLLRQPRWKTRLLLAFSKFVLGYSEPQMNMYRESLDSAMTINEMRDVLAASKLSMASVRGFRGLDMVITA